MDGEINKLVYELYGLSREEIDLIEGKKRTIKITLFPVPEKVPA